MRHIRVTGKKEGGGRRGEFRKGCICRKKKLASEEAHGGHDRGVGMGLDK